MQSHENMDSNQIQAELNRLCETKPTENLVKTALFNLVVYSTEIHRTQYFKDIIETIVKQFPCRLIFIQADANKSESCISVQVLASNSDNKQKSCINQMFIEASGEELKRVPFLILPHLISDLPIYLLWGQDPTTDTIILPLLQPLATRIIFDTETSEQFYDFSRTILNLKKNSNLEIVDMNWIRTSGWRQIISRAFDTKTRIDLIRKTSQMRLVYNDLGESSFVNPETQAIYLQAWIASCFEWQFEKMEIDAEHTKILYYKGPEHSIQINLSPVKREDLPVGEIVEWELRDENTYDCLFLRKTVTQVGVKASNRYQCLLPFTFSLPNLQTGKSLMQEIFYQKIGDHYSSLLQLISLIKGKQK